MLIYMHGFVLPWASSQNPVCIRCNTSISYAYTVACYQNITLKPFSLSQIKSFGCVVVIVSAIYKCTQTVFITDY